MAAVWTKVIQIVVVQMRMKVEAARLHAGSDEARRLLPRASTASGAGTATMASATPVSTMT